MIWSRLVPIGAAVLVAVTLVGVMSRTQPSAGTDRGAAPPPLTTSAPAPRGTATPVPPSGGCDPDYATCVPLVTDVDCTGEGDGPVFVDGPIRVLGKDHFGLDPDRDRIACN